MQDPKIKRILIVSAILLLICIVCLFVSVRTVDKYKNKVVETVALKQKLDNLEQDLKNVDFRIKELEARRYALSIEKRKISDDYSLIKEDYVSFGKTIKVLERDVNTLKTIVKDNEEVAVVTEEDGDDVPESRLSELQNQNDKLLQELAKKTKEKMILEIAFKAQAKKLGLSEGYDPDLKEILKTFVTSLQ